MYSRAALSKRRAQSNPPSGWLQSTRRRLWTTFPLPMINTPRERSGASFAPSSRW